jgi:hypothetical protein
MSIKPVIALLLVAIATGVASALTVLTLASGDDEAKTADILAAIENRVTELEAQRALPLARGEQSRQPADQATVSVVQVAEPEQRRNNDNFRGASEFQLLMDDSQDPEVRLARARELLDSRFPPARLMATQTLVELGDEQALDAVRELVAQVANDRRSQRTAEAAIGMLSDAQGSAVDTQL